MGILRQQLIAYAQRAISKCRHLWNRFYIHPFEKKFISHNKRLWGQVSCQSSGEILVEANTIASTIIAQSYLANILAAKFNSRIVAYSMQTPKHFRKSIFKIYRSCNAIFLFFQLTQEQRADASALFESVISCIRTKRDIENLSIEGILIGDLIYDSYLKKYRLPTIDPGSKTFHDCLSRALKHFVYWRDYLRLHPVKALLVSHCVYFDYAIPLRIAVSRKIPVYQVNATSIYSITESHNMRAYNEFFDYPEEFAELDPDQQHDAKQSAKERLNMRFSGRVGVDMHYSSQSAYHQEENSRVLQKNHCIKILVATHCFFDSPHPWGINLFPDFYEWLLFLGDISLKKDYDWYIKTHPDFLPGNYEILEEFVQKYPRFKIIPSDTSHHQLIREGIDYALTVYGTIGMEYAALGKTVINASMCNPHIRYGFNVHPPTVQAYEEILLNLESLNHSISVDEVYEYYYCRHIDRADDWLFNDYHRFIEQIGGHREQIKPVSYRYFLNEFDPKKHNQIIHFLTDFIVSGDYYLRPKHIRLAKETLSDNLSFQKEAS